MKNCVDCGREIPEEALYCMFCRAEQPVVTTVTPDQLRSALRNLKDEIMSEVRELLEEQHQQKPGFFAQLRSSLEELDRKTGLKK